jgi:hypothetical protein
MVSTRASKCLDPTTTAEKELQHTLVQKMGVRKYRKWLKTVTSPTSPQKPPVTQEPPTPQQQSPAPKPQEPHVPQPQPTAKSVFMSTMRARAATRLSVAIATEQNSQYTMDMCHRHWRNVPSFEEWFQAQSSDVLKKHKITAAKRLINEHIQKDLILGTPNHSRNSIHLSLSSWLDAIIYRKALMEYLETSPQCLEWLATLDPEMASLLIK